MIGRLIVPLALTIGALLLLRRWIRPPAGVDGGLRIVARAGLTRSAVVAIVAVGTRRFLLGASEAGVRLLQELEPAAIEEQVEPDGMETVAQRPWTGLVDRLRERTLRAAGGGPGHAARR